MVSAYVIRNGQTNFQTNFAFPPIVYDCSSCSISIPAVGVSILCFSYSNWYVVVAHPSFNLNFEHLSCVCLLSYIFCGEMSVQIFCLLFNWVVFLLWSFESSLYILNTNIFFQTVAYHVILLVLPFSE